MSTAVKPVKYAAGSAAVRVSNGMQYYGSTESDQDDQQPDPTPVQFNVIGASQPVHGQTVKISTFLKSQAQQ